MGSKKSIKFVLLFYDIMQVEAERTRIDVIDFLSDACLVNQEIKTEDGGTQLVSITDTKKAWWKTLVVNSSTLGRFAFVVEELLNKGHQAYFHMSGPKARVFEKQVEDKYKSYMYSLDAKSSESLRDRHNAQSTLVDKLVRNRQERIVTLKEEMKKSMWEGFTGNDSNRNARDD